MPIPGKKNMRNEPEMYDELKRQRSIALTDTGAKMLDELAEQYALSRSEFVERIARRIIKLFNPWIAKN